MFSLWQQSAFVLVDLLLLWVCSIHTANHIYLSSYLSLKQKLNIFSSATFCLLLSTTVSHSKALKTCCPHPRFFVFFTPFLYSPPTLFAHHTFTSNLPAHVSTSLTQWLLFSTFLFKKMQVIYFVGMLTGLGIYCMCLGYFFFRYGR